MTSTQTAALLRKPRRLSLRHGLVVAACLAASLGAGEARAADAALDTVMLANGGRLRGTVMEEDPQKGTSIKLVDGTIKRVAAGDVKQVLYAGSAPAAPPTPAPVAATPQAPTRMAVPVQAVPGVLPAMGGPYAGPYPGQYYGPYAPPRRHGGGKGVLVAGLVILSVGAATAAIGGALVSDNGGKSETTAGIGTIAVGGGLFVIGGLMAIIGAAVGSSSSSDAMTEAPRVAVKPWLGPSRGGLTVVF